MASETPLGYIIQACHVLKIFWSVGDLNDGLRSPSLPFIRFSRPTLLVYDKFCWGMLGWILIIRYAQLGILLKLCTVCAICNSACLCLTSNKGSLLKLGVAGYLSRSRLFSWVALKVRDYHDIRTYLAETLIEVKVYARWRRNKCSRKRKETFHLTSLK